MWKVKIDVYIEYWRNPDSEKYLGEFGETPETQCRDKRYINGIFQEKKTFKIIFEFRDGIGILTHYAINNNYYEMDNK